MVCCLAAMVMLMLRADMGKSNGFQARHVKLPVCPGKFTLRTRVARGAMSSRASAL